MRLEMCGGGEYNCNSTEEGGDDLKLNCYQDSTISENRVDIYCREKDREVIGIIDYINSYETIIGQDDDVAMRILPSEIFYCEIVDRKCYAYLESEVFRIDFSLSGFCDRFARSGFVQISKSMIVNVYKIKRFTTDLNMKMTLYLENGEAVILNRAYKKNFMDYLKKMREDAL
ncbi:MAG: LytTR family DNA-binding domain-containing protein [Acutalibacteraceae bacterium]